MSRQYVSEHRAVAAQQTRARILDAAERELRDVGYHAMTVSGLARRADVSPQTIYNAVGSKAAVIKALYDVLLVGDDEPVPMVERPEFIAMLNRPDGISTIRAYLSLGTRIYCRVGELLGILLVDGPGADGELRSFVSTIERERRIGNESIVRHIETTFGLPANVTTQRAADVLWAATSFELADRLVRRCGWSPVEFEAWAADLVVMSTWGPAAISTPDQ
jgi:AcrR family transcriptional regulator